MHKHLETRAMFAGHRPSDANMAIKPPMHPASTFVFPDARTGAAHMETAYGVEGAETPPDGFIYSRLGNPTVTMAEQRLAAWDSSEDAALFGSGMAAISTALLAWSGKDRPVWFVGPLYGGTHHFLDEVLPSMGREVAEMDHLDQLDPTLVARGGQRPGIIYLETPANPTMQIQRIRTAAEWATQHSTDDHRILVMVDNTYLGPVLQRPLEQGADLVLYSATKYLGGHSDLIAGGASGCADVVAKVKEFRTFLGGTIDAWTAWMLARSMETLHVRVERQQQSTGAILQSLRELCGQDAVSSAWEEDLHAMGQDVSIAQAQQLGGGAMIGLEVPGGREGAFAFLDALEVFQLAVSLGSTESLAEHPASMTHAGVPAEVKAQTGITEGFVRLSIGLEHPEDLMADLAQAWKVAQSVATLVV
jgi:methionine-gamma-lyase